MPSASSTIATHRFDRCQRWRSPKRLPRIRSAALGLFRHPAQQRLDSLLHKDDDEGAGKRNRWRRMDGVDDLGSTVAGAELDGADVVADRQAGEDGVGEPV